MARKVVDVRGVFVYGHRTVIVKKAGAMTSVDVERSEQIESPVLGRGRGRGAINSLLRICILGGVAGDQERYILSAGMVAT